ncbi:MAG: hypothetical protein HY314_01380 [Acidobacteria bacterium]|nr:hypothetical protein [Acidobacteriota bacterium]
MQIIVDVVTDAVRSGLQFISQKPMASLDGQDRASRFRRWGLIAFWAGLAALLGIHMGIILILVGIGLMAYARGFFGPVKESPSVREGDFQAPPSRETNYSSNPTRPSAVSEGGRWNAEGGR